MKFHFLYLTPIFVQVFWGPAIAPVTCSFAISSLVTVACFMLSRPFGTPPGTVTLTLVVLPPLHNKKESHQQQQMQKKNKQLGKTRSSRDKNVKNKGTADLLFCKKSSRVGGIAVHQPLGRFGYGRKSRLRTCNISCGFTPTLKCSW